MNPDNLGLFWGLLNIIQVLGCQLSPAKGRFCEWRLFDARTTIGHWLVLEFVQPSGFIVYVLVHFAQEVLDGRLVSEAAHGTHLIFGMLNYEIGLALE